MTEDYDQESWECWNSFAQGKEQGALRCVEIAKQAADRYRKAGKYSAVLAFAADQIAADIRREFGLTEEKEKEKE